MPGGLGGEEAAGPLREARGHRGRAIRARAMSWVLGLMATFTTLVAVAAWPASLVGKLIFLALALTPAILAVRARARSGASTEKEQAALEQAWLSAAEQVAAESKEGVTATELAKRLKVEPARADKLLTELAVHDRTRVDVGDDAEIRYSVTPDALAGARVRVEDPLAEAALEEAAEAEADADAGAASARRGARR